MVAYRKAIDIPLWQQLIVFPEFLKTIKGILGLIDAGPFYIYVCIHARRPCEIGWDTTCIGGIGFCDDAVEFQKTMVKEVFQAHHVAGKLIFVGAEGVDFGHMGGAGFRK